MMLSHMPYFAHISSPISCAPQPNRVASVQRSHSVDADSVLFCPACTESNMELPMAHALTRNRTYDALDHRGTPPPPTHAPCSSVNTPRHTGSVFFQLNAAALLAKGLNKTRCSHVKEAYEPDYGTQSMVARLFAVTVGTFFLVGGVLYAVQHMLASRDRARLIEGIIDADEGMDAADDMHVDMPMVHPGQAGHAHRRPNPQPQRGQRPQPNLQPIN